MTKSVTHEEAWGASSPAPSRKALGRRLRAVRMDQGLGRGTAARSAGLTRRELARYERGRRHPRIGELRSIAGSCGVELDDLLPPTTPPETPPDLPGGGYDPLDSPVPPPPGLRPEIPLPPERAVPETAWTTGTITVAEATIDHPHASDRGDARWAITDPPAADQPDHRAGDALVIEADVDFSGGPGFGVLVGARIDSQGRLSAYSFDIDPLSGGGGYVLRAWDRDRPHWWPLAGSATPDLAQLFGTHTVKVALAHDHLEAGIDGHTVLSVPMIGSCARGAGATPARGRGLGIIAWADSDLTVAGVRIAGR